MLSGLSVLAAALFLAACRQGAAEPVGSRIVFMTALPLFPASAAPAEILNGPDQRAAIIRALAARHHIIPIARLDEKALVGSMLIVAQPRGLAGEELVALDAWVRQGGKALIFSDPELVWPSELPFGDPRRAPPIGLLDPLLSHWGLELVSPAMNDDGPVKRIGVGKFVVAVAWAGKWRTDNPDCKIESDAFIAACRIGKGQVVLVADADMLDERLWQSSGSDNESAVLDMVSRVARSGHH
ncbi:GldG family protein [Aquisediminimonas profunda]|uniref:GldG family protein n=1 Tax=Aquisediminimonas profunda TaxID=1550733 RepID=UPI001C636035|nr:GldG family protein [Aquisediminimonas profunda]